MLSHADWRRYVPRLESDINLIFTPNGIHSQNIEYCYKYSQLSTTAELPHSYQDKTFNSFHSSRIKTVTNFYNFSKLKFFTHHLCNVFLLLDVLRYICIDILYDEPGVESATIRDLYLQ